MANKIDLTGKRFGRLVVLEQAEYHIDKKAFYKIMRIETMLQDIIKVYNFL